MGLPRDQPHLRLATAIQLFGLRQLQKALSQEDDEAAPRLRHLAEDIRVGPVARANGDVSRIAGNAATGKAAQLGPTTTSLIAGVRRWLRSSSGGMCIVVSGDEHAAETLLRPARRAAPSAQLVGTLSEARAVLHSAGPQVALIVVQQTLPDGPGVDLLLRTRRDPTLSSVPVLMVGVDSKAAQMEALALGATEVFTSAELPDYAVAVAVYAGFETTGIEMFVQDSRLTPTREAFEAAVRARAEDYALLRGEGWCLALFEVTNHGALEGGDPRARPVTEILYDAILERFPEGTTVGVVRPGVVGAVIYSHSAVAVAFGLDSIRRLPPPVQVGTAHIRPLVRGGVVHAGAASAGEVLQAADELLELCSRSDFTLKTRQLEGDARQTILVVEDDPVSAALVEISISQMGFTAVVCTDAESAIDLVSQEGRPPFALFLFDVQLPGSSGFELLEEIRRQPRLANIPAVFMSSSGSDRQVMHGLQSGADDYLIKPFNPKILAARLQAILARRSRGATAG